MGKINDLYDTVAYFVRTYVLYESFGQEMLLALVLLHHEADLGYDGSFDSVLYELLDRQSDAECAYYCACTNALDLQRGKPWAPDSALTTLAKWHQTTKRLA